VLKLKTPNGLVVDVPESVDEDRSMHFSMDQIEQAKDYFIENGYAVLSGVIPSADCDLIRDLWNSEVKPFKGKIYRQTTAKLERHCYNEAGWVMNPIINLQSLDPRFFLKTRKVAIERIISATNLSKFFRLLFNERPKIVQSMYFEGNSATWEHQDSYYLDSESLGTMAAAWIAIEDIAPKAGRFFVCPRSHLFDWERQSSENNIAYKHDVYVQSVVNKMKSEKFEVRAPALRKGDVLFWNAYTIHGSLDTQDPVSSRSSVTCHAIPESHRLIQMQSMIRRTDVDYHNDVAIYAPKDLSKWKNKLVYLVESNLPTPFYALKKWALANAVRSGRS
jgi:phytanoyl-CoA hydroxylase